MLCNHAFRCDASLALFKALSAVRMANIRSRARVERDACGMDTMHARGIDARSQRCMSAPANSKRVRHRHNLNFHNVLAMSRFSRFELDAVDRNHAHKHARLRFDHQSTDFFWTHESSCFHSSSVMRICWKVLSEANMLPPIHAACAR